MKGDLRVSIFFIFGICASCISLSDIPIPDSSHKVVVNALFSPDSTWKINVAFAGGATSDKNYFLPYIKDATVEIIDPGGITLSLLHVQNGNYRNNQYPQIGKNYQLKVFVPGFDTIRANSSIPVYLDEVEANWDLSQAVPQNDRWGGVFNAFPLSISFVDPNQYQNFYMLGMSYRDSCLCQYSTSNDSIYVDRFDDALKAQSIENTNLPDAIYQDDWRVLLSDQSFNGISKIIDLMVSDTTYIFYNSLGIPRDNLDTDSLPPSRVLGINQRLYIQAYADTWSLSEDLFHYMHSYFLQGKNTADPFASFNNVQGNIEGGLGIFAGYQRKLIQVYSD